ncbi:MAG TPA: ATP-binding protein [Prolixibacteraceae bacterium]|nr:ATP-binding protein [Prolixibacteraceae bacterium]
MQKHINIKNNIEQLPLLAEQIEKLGDEWQLDMLITTNLNLVLEEAISNIIFYAYNDDKEHEIDIKAKKSENVIIIVITDYGKPFDPTKKETPDISLSAEERQIGGLGIFLIQKIMNSVEYKREDKKNILTLTKLI